MNNIFNVKRIMLLLRADWIEYKKTFYLSAGLLFLAYILLLWNAGNQIQLNLYWFGLTITQLSYYSYIQRKMHKSKGLSLTLPASNPEKFTVLILVGLLYFIVYLAIYWLVIGINLLFTEMTPSTFGWLNKLWEYTYGALLFVFAFLFLAYMTLRKFALPVGLAALVLIVVAFVRIYFPLVKDSVVLDPSHLAVRSDAIYDTLLILGQGFNPAMCVASVVLLYISYLKLKEKEIK